MDVRIKCFLTPLNLQDPARISSGMFSCTLWSFSGHISHWCLCSSCFSADVSGRNFAGTLTPAAVEEFVTKHDISKHLTRPLKKNEAASVLYYCRHYRLYDCPYKIELRYPRVGDEIRVYIEGKHDHSKHKSKRYFPVELKEKVDHGVKCGMPAMKIIRVSIIFSNWVV